MKTTTKSEILKNFENQEFVQINFPKITVEEVTGFRRQEVEKEIPDDTVIYMRSELQNLDHFNTIYKDGSKYYLEETLDAQIRLCRRALGDEGSPQQWEDAGYCLYCCNYDMNEAKKMLRSRY